MTRWARHFPNEQVMGQQESMLFQWFWNEGEEQPGS